MVNLSNRLHNDNKTRNELLENVEISKTTYKDAYQIITILSKCFRN